MISQTRPRYFFPTPLCLLHDHHPTHCNIYHPYHDSRVPSPSRRNAASRFWLFYCGFSTHLLFIYTYMRSRLSYAGPPSLLSPTAPSNGVLSNGPMHPGGRLTYSFGTRPFQWASRRTCVNFHGVSAQIRSSQSRLIPSCPIRCAAKPIGRMNGGGATVRN